MLTNRQQSILEYYYHNNEKFITSKQTAEQFKISIRTVKNELKIIREYCGTFKSFELETISSKGTRLQILNKKHAQADFKKIKNNCINDTPDNRIEAIIIFLLDSSKKYISKYEIMDSFFISETTLYSHINEIKAILKKFHLSIYYKTGKGYTITGSELNKRICIGKIGLDYRMEEHVPEKAGKIYNIIVDTFIKYQYHIDEETVQNITAHVLRSLKRIEKFHFIEKNDSHRLNNTKEYQIAEEILSSSIGKSFIPDKYYHNEVNLLAQIVSGKLDYTENNDLQEQINKFISDSFESIYQKFSVNFDSIDNLRLLLGLHLVPLLYRIQSGTELTNPLREKIHDSFPQAYDIALYFTLLIENHFGLKVSKDEITYLALYFNYGLENYSLDLTSKKILIITPLRKSETILLRHKIFNQFPKQIETIDFIHPKSINSKSNINEYDAFFTTEENLEIYQKLIPYINLFPTEKDLKTIELSLEGYTSINTVLSRFNPKRLIYIKTTSKNEALRILIENSETIFLSKKDFYEFFHSIKEREKLNSTYFGNGIAIPHPLTPISNETFVSVAILENKIKWDDEHFINMILLVSIGKNNPKELQFWYYLSSFIQNKELIQKVIKHPTYENLISALEVSLKDI